MSNNNAQTTTAFFARTDVTTQNKILANIAAQYSITKEQALEEITGAGAESLIDYITGPERMATSVLMQRHGLA